MRLLRVLCGNSYLRKRDQGPDRFRAQSVSVYVLVCLLVCVLFFICPVKQDKVKCFLLIHSCVILSRANDLFGCVHTCCKRNQSTDVDGSFFHIHTISPACCQSEGNLSLPPFIFFSVTPPTTTTTSFLTSFLSPHKRTPRQKVSFRNKIKFNQTRGRI